jgi:hypothetical protein
VCGVLAPLTVQFSPVYLSVCSNNRGSAWKKVGMCCVKCKEIEIVASTGVLHSTILLFLPKKNLDGNISFEFLGFFGIKKKSIDKKNCLCLDGHFNIVVMNKCILFLFLWSTLVPFVFWTFRGYFTFRKSRLFRNIKH